MYISLKEMIFEQYRGEHNVMSGRVETIISPGLLSEGHNYPPCKWGREEKKKTASACDTANICSAIDSFVLTKAG